MPTPKQGSRFDGSASHQKGILANLAKQLIGHGETKTTDTKAKLLCPYVGELITKAKRGTLADCHSVTELLSDDYAVKKLFDEIGSQFTDRGGGYTRIIKLGDRKGDNAPISLIAPVEEETTTAETTRVARITTSEQAEETKAEEAEAETIEKEQSPSPTVSGCRGFEPPSSSPYLNALPGVLRTLRRHIAPDPSSVSGYTEDYVPASRAIRKPFGEKR